VPARLRDLKRVLEGFGVVIKTASGTSHYMAYRGGTSYPIPAHNGLKTEIADVYIRGICRVFSLDEKAVRKKL
jgi:hypothetical protein